MGRKYVGKKKTYRINETIYTEFKEWCSERGLTVSEAIRQILTKEYVEDMLETVELTTLTKLKKGEKVNEI